METVLKSNEKVTISQNNNDTLGCDVLVLFLMLHRPPFIQSVVTNGSVKIPPFEVRPSILELMKGDTGVLEVIFAPHAVRSFTQEITIVCDNCHVKHFTLKGLYCYPKTENLTFIHDIIICSNSIFDDVHFLL